MKDMTATEVMVKARAYRHQLDKLNDEFNDTLQAMREYGLLAGVGETICPSTTPGVRIVTSRLSILGGGVNPFHRVPSVPVDQLLYGDRSSFWTKLKIRTIYSTDPSQAASQSKASLMIGGRAARTLSTEEICKAIDDGEPLDVVWVKEDNDLSPNSE